MGGIEAANTFLPVSRATKLRFTEQKSSAFTRADLTRGDSLNRFRGGGGGVGEQATVIHRKSMEKKARLSAGGNLD